MFSYRRILHLQMRKVLISRALKQYYEIHPTFCCGETCYDLKVSIFLFPVLVTDGNSGFQMVFT